MRDRPAFSLIELMLALALSSFIMLGMVQGYRNVLTLLRNAKNLLSVNRRVALLFNQIERDFTTAIAYSIPRKMPVRQRETNGKQETFLRSGRNEKSNANGSTTPLSLKGEIYEDHSYRVKHKKWQLLRSVSLLSTNPLEVYGNMQQRLVRVVYELKLDKGNSTPQHESYLLIRKESVQPDNVSLQTKDDEAQGIKEYIVADRVRLFSIEYVYKVRPKKGEDDKVGEDVIQKTFIWAEKEERKASSTILPEYVTLHIELWADEQERSYAFECLIPLLVRDKAGAVKFEEKKLEDSKISEKGDDTKAADILKKISGSQHESDFTDVGDKHAAA